MTKLISLLLRAQDAWAVLGRKKVAVRWDDLHELNASRG